MVQIETFVTFCGMVWLQAMVLGRLGMKLPSSKSVCSILPIAVCWPRLYGAPAFILPLAALYRLILTQRDLRFSYPTSSVAALSLPRF